VLPAYQDLHNGAAIVVVVNDVVVVISVAIIEAVVDVVIVIDIVVVVSVADIVAVVDVVIVLDAEGLSTPWHEQQGSSSILLAHILQTKAPPCEMQVPI